MAINNPTTLEERKDIYTGGATPQVEPYRAFMDRVTQINNEIAAQGNKDFSVAPSAITADSLQNAKPVSLPQTPISTSAQGLSAISTAVGDQTRAANDLARETEQKRIEAEAKTTESKSKYQQVIDQITGVFGSRDKLETDAKIGEKSQKITDVTNQIEALDRAEVNEIRGLEGQAITEGQRSQILSEIQRKYSFQKADLALIQSAANRDLATAQNIVERKIQLQLEPLKFQLDFVKDFYNENKADLTKEEDKAFGLKAKELEREYDIQKTLQETIGKLQISAASQGADPSVVQAIGRAKNIGEASAAAGQFAGDIVERQIKQAQLAKLNAEAQKTRAEALAAGGFATGDGKVALPVAEAQKVNKELTSNDAYKVVRKGQDSLQFLNDFEKLFKETGATSAVFSPRENAALKAKYNATILNLKEFFNLGVLNGPDEAILKSIVPDPTNRSATANIASLSIYNPAKGTEAGIANMKKQIEDTLDDRFASLSTQYSVYSPQSVTSLGDLQRIYIQNKALLNPDVNRLVEENPDLTTDDIISIINKKL
jgi:hypothetical protein